MVRQQKQCCNLKLKQNLKITYVGHIWFLVQIQIISSTFVSIFKPVLIIPPNKYI